MGVLISRKTSLVRTVLRDGDKYSFGIIRCSRFQEGFLFFFPFADARVLKK